MRLRTKIALGFTFLFVIALTLLLFAAINNREACGQEAQNADCEFFTPLDVPITNPRRP